MSIRDKFRKLGLQKGSRREFVKLANREGLTDKTEPRKKLKNNVLTISGILIFISSLLLEFLNVNSDNKNQLITLFLKNIHLIFPLFFECNFS